MPGSTTPPSVPRRLRRTASRTALLALVWVVITEADPHALAVGIPIVLAGSALSLTLSPDSLTPIRPSGALRFVRFFALQSALGGIDVSMRALRPSMPLDPAIIRYPLRITGTWPRVFLANTISMLPGTLSSRLDDDTLEVHVLDCSRPVVQELAEVECRVADLFGSDLPPLTKGDA
ncbi:MAG: Na+/H+ antiporter subunit E [Coriobacteriia bacterium]|nr:Na+/H+ antiporter subunit E [Coriobacteriia bacterium]